MNKKNVDFNRFNKACSTVRPTGSKISDKNMAGQIREYYSFLSEVAAAEETKIFKPAVSEEQTAYEYLYAKDVAALLNIGMSKAYELIAEANKKLHAKGKYIIPGRVPRRFFMEQLY